MGKIGRPAFMVVSDIDRGLAAANLNALQVKWRLTTGDLMLLLGIGAGVLSAVRNERRVASSVAIGKALQLRDSDVLASGIIEEREARAEKQRANIASMIRHANQFSDPVAPAAPREPDPEREEDKDIPFT